jgi:hypothetical protein
MARCSGRDVICPVGANGAVAESFPSMPRDHALALCAWEQTARGRSSGHRPNRSPRNAGPREAEAARVGKGRTAVWLIRAEGCDVLAVRAAHSGEPPSAHAVWPRCRTCHTPP